MLSTSWSIVRSRTLAQEETTQAPDGGQRCGVDVHCRERVGASSEGIETRAGVVGGGVRRMRVKEGLRRARSAGSEFDVARQFHRFQLWQPPVSNNLVAPPIPNLSEPGPSRASMPHNNRQRILCGPCEIA